MKKLSILLLTAFSFLPAAAETIAQGAKTVSKETKTELESKTEALAKSGLDVHLDLKVRYVDAFEIMQKSKLGLAEAEKLQEMNKNWTEEITAKGQKLEQEARAFEAKKTTMSEAAAQAEAKRLAKDKRDLEARVQECQQDFQMAQQKATERILKEMRECATQVAKAEGLDVIIDKMTGQVLYSSPQSECSNSIIALMDKKSPAATPTKVASTPKKEAPKAKAS